MNSTSPRAPMTLVARRARAYFAPVDRATSTPVIFDAATAAAFNPDAPPAPWLDLGQIDNLQRSSATKIEPLRAGARAATIAQFRGPLEARVEFNFADWGKLQMALAGGGEHRNALSGAAVPLTAPSTANSLVVGAAASGFAPGDLVAVDLDYAGGTGYIGTGIPGAYLKAAIADDPDYIRRVSFNLARIAAINNGALALAQPLLGGAPANAARVQKVVAFFDREGGSFFQEWSALFVISSDHGGRLFLNYPRLEAAAAPAPETHTELAPPLDLITLHAGFTALPAPDPHDAEPTLCYRVWQPAGEGAVR